MIKVENTITKKTNAEEKDSFFLDNNLLIINKKRTLPYISFAKIMASFGVISLHLNNFWEFGNIKTEQWLIENFYQTFFYYSVPIFVLCIGATLVDFNERYGLFEYNKKRLIKVYIPLIGWTCILYLFKVYILKNTGKIIFSFRNVWNYFFLSKINHIFKSLHIFILTYLLIPLVSFVEKNNKIRIYSYYFFVLLIVQGIIPYLISLFGNKLVWIYNLNVGYLIYIFAGYIIHNHVFSKYSKIVIYLLGISFFLVHLIGTKYLTLKYKHIILIHKGYNNLPPILYSCAMFLFIKEYSYLIFNIINKKYINKLGSLTLGPFFLHYAVKETLFEFKEFNKFIRINLIFYTFVIFSICIIISFILKQIPLLKILVP